jgi:tetratricopeptide (TPR) repeat protein
MVNRGQALLELGRYPEALASYENVIALDPNFADVWNNLGAVQVLLDRNAEAVASFDKALAIDPEDTIAKVNRELARNGTHHDPESRIKFHKE